MLILLRMAWKNLFRYKKRTVITAFAIAIGVMFSIAVEALLVGLDQESFRNLIWYETSSAKVFAPGYFKDRQQAPIDRLIPASQRPVIEDALTSEGLSFTPRYQSMAEVFFLEDSFPAAGSLTGIVYGVDPLRDGAVYRIASSVEEGRWLSPGEEGVVLGSWLAYDMQAEVGYYVTIQCKGKGGFVQTMDVPVVGIAQTDNPVVNSTAMYMDLEFLNEMLELEGDVSDYSLSSSNLSALQGADYVGGKLSALQGWLGTVELYRWDQLAEDEVSLSKTKSASSRVLMLFMFIIAAVGISNTMLMAVMERKNEVGMLKALGYPSSRIEFLFTAEGVFLGFLGSLVGMIGGVALTYPMVVHGLDFSSMLAGVNIGYRVSGVMRGAWSPESFFIISGGALLVSAISAWLPVRKMSRTEIAVIFRKI